MGQSTSTEYSRFDKIRLRLIPEARQRVNDLWLAAAAEKAAGIPPAHGSKQALHQAAYQHQEQLLEEMFAIYKRLLVLTKWWEAPLAPKMPQPTPTWEEVLAALTVPVAEPSTPAGSSSPGRRQRGSSSSSDGAGMPADDSSVPLRDAGMPADDIQLSEAALLLPGGAGPSAPGLRRRQGS